MPARKPRERIEIDVLFAPLPQHMLLDRALTAQACRLWGVLYVFRWNHEPPDFDRLAAAMGSTERSVYRWLSELESAGWIDWDRNASLQDRFVLRTSPHGPEIDTCVKTIDRGVNSDDEELTPRSIKLIPRSKELIPRSIKLTQVSILDAFPGVLMPQNDPLQIRSDHDQKIQNGGGGEAPLAELLIARGVGEIAAAEIAMSHHDPDTIIQSLDNMLTDGAAAGHDPDNVCGRFVLRFRRSPPEKGKPYGRRRSIQPDVPQDRPRRRAAGDAPDPGRAALDAALARFRGES